MGVPSEIDRIQYAGNGVTTAFAVPFPFFLATDLLVILRTTSSGNEAVKLFGPDYSVSGMGTGVGTVTFVTAPSNLVTVHIINAPLRTQALTLVDGQALPASSVVGAFDKIVLQAQRAYALARRALNLKETDSPGLGSFSAEGQRITNLGAPTASGDAVPKSYVDSLIPPTGSPTPPFFAQTAHEIAAAVTPSSTLYEPGDIRRYGAVGDGVANDTSPIQQAIDVAANGLGFVRIPAGAYRVTSGYTITRGILITGVTQPPGGTGSTVLPGSIIMKQFSGDLFTFNGSAGAVPGAGGGVWNLRLVNDFGAGVTAGGAGKAIRIHGNHASNRPSWVSIRNCLIEYGVARDSWTWAIEVDGSSIPVIVPDITLVDVSTHTASSSGGAVRMLCATGQISNCSFFDTQGNVTISGTAGAKSSVRIIGTEIAGTLAYDQAVDCHFIGGTVSKITNTANMTGNCLLLPGRLVNAFVNNAGAACGLLHHSTQLFATLAGSFRFSHAPALANAQHLFGINAAGTAAFGLVGVSAADRVQISKDGADIQLGLALIALGGGAAPTFGTIGGTGPTTAGQNSWLRLFDAFGNAFWVPAWR